MTAQLLEYTSASDARVRRVRAARAASVRASVAPHRVDSRIQASWGTAQVRACEVARPAPVPVVAPHPAVAPAPTVATRLEWTPRGIAVIVSLVAIVTGVMLTTLVGAFLAVSDAPLVALVAG